MLSIFIFFISFVYNVCKKNLNILNKGNKNKIINSSFEYNFLDNNNIKKNAILGIIQKYSINKILPFFKSMIKANFTNCDVVMFVRYVPKNVIDYLKRINVIVYEISEEYKNVTRPTHLRWKMYINFLKDNKNKYNIIFCSDVVDVIFQKDIFKYYENHKSFLGLAIEDGTLDHEWSRKNIINFVGVKKHNIIHKNRIICMGTILGTSEKILEFSIILWETLKSNGFPLSDQGIANCLFYLDKIFDNFLVKSDNYGPIMTIGLSNRKNISLDKEQNILNFGGEVAAVVHQYDRMVDIQMILENKFCPESCVTFESGKSNSFNKQSVKKKK